MRVRISNLGDLTCSQYIFSEYFWLSTSVGIRLFLGAISNIYVCFHCYNDISLKEENI